MRFNSFLILLLFLNFIGWGQVKTNSIDEVIKSKKGNKTQAQFLQNFKKDFPEDSKITVEENKTYYLLIVSHKGSEASTGGAEQYKLIKKTGKYEMLWHEHPMKLPNEEIQLKKE